MIKVLLTRFPRKSFVRNFSVLLSSSALVSLMAMITSIYIARVLSPKHYGEYGVILSLVAIFQVVGTLGLSATTTRTIARNQEQSLPIFRTSLLAYFGGFLIAVIFYFLYLYFNKETNSSLMIGLVICSLLSLSLWDMCQNVAFGMQRMEYIGIINLIMTSVLLINYIIIPTRYITVELVFAISVANQLIKDLLFYLSCRKAKLFTGKIDPAANKRREATQLIKDSFPFLVMALFSMMSNQMPILFLNANSGAEQVAYFNTANKLLMPITLIITTAMTALFPNLSKLYLVDKELYKEKIQTALSIIALLGVVGAITISFFRSEVVAVLYGKEYENTGMVIAYQCWFMIAFSFFCFFGGIFSSSDKQKLLSYLSIAYAIISVPILWLGSYYGAEYLSLAFIITAVINMSYHWYFMQKILPTPFTKSFTIKLFAATIIPFLFSLFIPENLDIIMRAVIYLFVLTIIGLMVKEKVKSFIRVNFANQA